MADEDEPERIESATVKATSVRLDDAMMQAVQEEAARLGTNPSDFIRVSITMRLTMISTARTIQAGVDPATIADTDSLIGILNDAERLARRRQGRQDT